MVAVLVHQVLEIPRNQVDATERRRTRIRIRTMMATMQLLRMRIRKLTNRQRRKVVNQRDPRQRKKRSNKVAIAAVAAKQNKSINKANNRLYPSLVVNNNHSSQQRMMKPNPRVAQVLLDVPVKLYQELWVWNWKCPLVLRLPVRYCTKSTMEYPMCSAMNIIC